MVSKAEFWQRGVDGLYDLLSLVLKHTNSLSRAVHMCLGLALRYLLVLSLDS